MKIFNRAIEPNEYSCALYKSSIELCQQTFEEYMTLNQREQKHEKGSLPEV